MRPAVLVLGGYGTFGRLICESLARHGELRVIVAGRDPSAAEALCRKLSRTASGAAVEPFALDLRSPEFPAHLAALAPSVVIDTVGPFQARDYRVPRACIESGAHFLDLADGREYVEGISALDAAARAANVAVIGGASTCPAISTAVVDRLAEDLIEIETICTGLSPGPRTPRGLATARAVLSYCGKPIPALIERRANHVFGWSGVLRHEFPAPAGKRWLALVDLPEMALWPHRYATLRTIETRAGFSSAILHFSIVLLGRAVRAGLIESADRYARGLLRLATPLGQLGRAVGAMYIEVTGRKRTGERVRRTWTLIAERGSGPRVPVTPSALLAKKLLALPGYAPFERHGAMPCIGLLTLEEILGELSALPIRTGVIEETVA